MILQQVAYHVFEHESAEPWATDRFGWHQMDGQVVLTFKGQSMLFISWGNGPIQYSIEQKDHSFFNDGLLLEMEMSQHPYWQPLINQEIVLSYVDEQHQVLAATHGENNLFISSQYDDGMFGGDCVRVSHANPL